MNEQREGCKKKKERKKKPGKRTHVDAWSIHSGAVIKMHLNNYLICSSTCDSGGI